jgi:hypothetical protein
MTAKRSQIKVSVPYSSWSRTPCTSCRGSHTRSPSYLAARRSALKSVRVHADRDDEKVPAAREKAWTIDQLHVEIKSKMDELKTKGKFTETDLDTTARDALKTLPYEVALVCLNKIANDTSAISNMNAFIVKNCTHLRNQWGVEDTSSATEEDDDDHREDENYLDAATRNLLCYDGKTRAWLSYVDEQFGTWRDDFPFLELKKLASTATQNLAKCTVGQFQSHIVESAATWESA